MKSKWKNTLEKLINDKRFQEKWNGDWNLSEYKLQLMEEGHLDQVLTLMCYTFSCLGGPANHQILMTTPCDSYPRFKCELQHSLKTGLNYVILDKYNRVVSVYYGFDYKDRPNYKGAITEKVKRIKEMHSYIWKNTEYLQSRFDYDLDKNVEFGDILCDEQGAIRPDSNGKKLVTYRKSKFDLPRLVGYKYTIGEAVNPITINIAHKKSLTNFYDYRFFSKIYDFRNFMFKDGVNMKDIIDNLRIKYKLSNEYVEYMRNNCKESIQIHDYTTLKRGTHSDFNKWININYLKISKL